MSFLKNNRLNHRISYKNKDGHTDSIIFIIHDIRQITETQSWYICDSSTFGSGFFSSSLEELSSSELLSSLEELSSFLAGAFSSFFSSY